MDICFVIESTFFLEQNLSKQFLKVLTVQ